MNGARPAPRILLIEDEILVAGMLRGMLASLGYAVVGTTANGDEATEILDRERVDAVVLDINLNGEMSYPIADDLAVRGIPFIFSTGYGRPPENYEGYLLLKKPFRRSALGAALADLLKGRTGGDVRPFAAEAEAKPENLHENRTA
jgi:CheY-like chemotaxis protein